jgi:hypothetical protein
VWRDDGRGTMVNRNDSSGWSSNGVVLWLGRRQNRDVIEWWGEWPWFRWSVYSSGGWESGGPGRVTCCSSAASMVQFWLKRGGDGMKLCRKMKRRQQVHLGSMGRKRDMVRWCGNVGRRRGGTGAGKWRRWHQLGWRESYWTEKWRKFTRSIQLLQMDGEDLK